MKQRSGPDGVHVFSRQTGLNVLLDELRPPQEDWSEAPRQISIALTNLCDLQCNYCYAPKNRSALSATKVKAWIKELDTAGCLGIGFGGGEPTLHPDFANICRYAADNTQMAVTFTTHGHRLQAPLLEQLSGRVHFIRVSVDGVGETYQAQRNKSFSRLHGFLKAARRLAPLGINVVVNQHTIGQLDDIADLAVDVGAAELLLLPQQATSKVAATDSKTLRTLVSWVDGYRGELRLAVSESGSGDFMVCRPLPLEKGLRAYAHIDASGALRANSYEARSVTIGNEGVMAALKKLENMEQVHV